MPKVTRPDFIIDSDTMIDLFNIIKNVKSIRVENFADTLTDRPKPAIFTDQEIAWMKSTLISTITLGPINGSDFFDLLVDGVPKLKISARSNTNWEFRGIIVRELIEQARSSTQTVYDTFQSHISQVDKNPLFLSRSNRLISYFLANLGIDNHKSDIFQALHNQLRKALNTFALSVFNALDETNSCLVALDKPCRSLPPEAYEFLNEQLKRALDNTLFKAQINFIYTFEDQLHVIEEQLSHFTKDSEPFDAADALIASLNDAKHQFFDGKITGDVFKNQCKNACNTAQDSVLKDLHGWKELLANIVFIVTSIVTLGVANLISKHALKGGYHFFQANTDRIRNIQAIKQTIEGITFSDNPSTGDQGSTSHTL